MNILIVGAGKVGYFLAKRLIADKHTVSIIDKDRATCEEIAKELDILVIHGDGCDPRILEEAGVERAEVVAAVTGDDEDNLVVCQITKERFNVRRTVGRINDSKNEKIFTELGVDVPIDSTAIIAKIIKGEAAFEDFVNLMSFQRGKLAIVRLDLPEDSPVINKKVMEVELPPDAVLVSILRGDEVIIPKGNTVFMPSDDVIAITSVGNEARLLKILVGKL
ncbi:MAG: NAD-binding protein [Candidatus Omnitrophota bacterium]|nr:NAD-binding protein [Candidatus Omnitrophota bacterium]